MCCVQMLHGMKAWFVPMMNNSDLFTIQIVGFSQSAWWQPANHKVSKERGGDYHAMASTQGMLNESLKERERGWVLIGGWCGMDTFSTHSTCHGLRLCCVSPIILLGVCMVGWLSSSTLMKPFKLDCEEKITVWKLEHHKNLKKKWKECDNYSAMME